MGFRPHFLRLWWRLSLVVLLRWLVHLNGGGSSGVTVRVRARTVAGKSGRGGGFSGSSIEPWTPAHADNHPESNLHSNQRSFKDFNLNSLPYLISPKFV
jgi:hypothetical protein